MSTSAYDRWVMLSAKAMDAGVDTTNYWVNRLIGAASSAMAELNLRIAELEGAPASIVHPSQDFPWQPGRPTGLIEGSGRRGQPKRLRSSRSRCPGVPHRGHASSDWSCPLDAIPGETATERDIRLRGHGADVDYPEVYQLACTAARGRGIAEEALNLLDELDDTPAFRVNVMQRARELRRQLAALEP